MWKDIIPKCQGNENQTIMRYLFTLYRVASIKKTTNKHWWGCGKRYNPGSLVVGMKICVVTLEKKILKFLKKKIEVPYKISLLGIFQRKQKL